MEQISLGLTLDRRDEPAIPMTHGQRRTLSELMAAAIIAVHRASPADASKEGDDDDSRE